MRPFQWLCLGLVPAFLVISFGTMAADHGMADRLKKAEEALALTQAREEVGLAGPKDLLQAEAGVLAAKYCLEIVKNKDAQAEIVKREYDYGIKTQAEVETALGEVEKKVALCKRMGILD